MNRMSLAIRKAGGDHLQRRWRRRRRRGPALEMVGGFAYMKQLGQARRQPEAGMAVQAPTAVPPIASSEVGQGRLDPADPFSIWVAYPAKT